MHVRICMYPAGTWGRCLRACAQFTAPPLCARGRGDGLSGTRSVAGVVVLHTPFSLRVCLRAASVPRYSESACVCVFCTNSSIGYEWCLPRFANLPSSPLLSEMAANETAKQISRAMAVGSLLHLLLLLRSSCASVHLPHPLRHGYDDVAPLPLRCAAHVLALLLPCALRSALHCATSSSSPLHLLLRTNGARRFRHARALIRKKPPSRKIIFISVSLSYWVSLLLALPSFPLSPPPPKNPAPRHHEPLSVIRCEIIFISRTSVVSDCWCYPLPSPVKTVHRLFCFVL